MRAAVVCSDLMFRSKLRDAITRAGHEPVASSGASVPVDVDAGVVDLGEARFEPVVAIRSLRERLPSVPILGFASHVRDDLLEARRRAGCSDVVPRSKALDALLALLTRSD